MIQSSHIAKPTAAEDLKTGDFIAVLRAVDEWLPFSCDGDEWKSRTEPKRVLMLPETDDLDPMRVVSICLPFILTARPDGRHKTIDARRVRLALLPRPFGRKAFRCLTGADGDKAKKKRKKK